MSREKLAYVATIKEYKPIEGKDAIVLASFVENGWEVIVRKEDFKPGDLCIYVEYDTILPVRPEYDSETFRKRAYREKYNGFVINAMKMAGVVSYGITFAPSQFGLTGVKAGDDLTKVIGVQSRDELDAELEALLALKRGKSRSFWKRLRYRIASYFEKKFPRLTAFLTNKRKEYPYPIPKSDETRVENLPDIYEEMKGKYVDCTIKMDGQSIGISVINGFFSLMSRNNVLIGAPLEKLLKVDAELPLEQWLKKVDKISHCAYFDAMVHALGVCYRDKWFQMAEKLRGIMGGDFGIQGELCGPGIQKNPMGLKELRWFVFNLTKDRQRYYTWRATKKILEQVGKEIWQVPLARSCKFEWEDKKSIKAFVAGFKYENNSPAEGIVFRHCLNENAEFYEGALKGMSNMASLKVIADAYALSHGG